MTEQEIREMKIELVETTDLISYSLKNNLPMSPEVLPYLIEKIRDLRKRLADIECDLMWEIQKQVYCN